MRGIAHRIWWNVRQHGDREAIVAPDGRLTYREFGALVRGIQDKLLAETHSPERVGVVTGDSIHTYAAIIAVLACGAAYVPINPKNPRRRNLDVVNRARLDLVLTHDEQLLAGLATGDFPSVLGVRDVTPSTDAWSIADTNEDSLAYILFTSGSTGQPKGVPITHGNLEAFMDSTFGSGPYDAQPTDRFLQMFELTFDLSVMCIFAPLLHGAAVCVVPEHGIGFMNVAKILADERVTVALMVPSVLSYMKRYMSELSFPDVKLNLFCGEALTAELLTLWTGCVPNALIENTYGPTEATIFCSRFRYDGKIETADVFQGVVSIGRQLDGTELLVLDEDGDPVPRGQQGELCIAGPQIMTGYWNDPEKTAEALGVLEQGARRTRFYRTGDIAFVNDRGNVMFCGRKDSQVKIDGHRVELGEIEHRARAYLGHAMVAALLIDTADAQKGLVLFVEMPTGTGTDALRNHLAEQLPEYMRPARIEAIDRMPLNLNGKIDRPAIRQAFENAAPPS